MFYLSITSQGFEIHTCPEKKSATKSLLILNITKNQRAAVASIHTHPSLQHCLASEKFVQRVVLKLLPRIPSETLTAADNTTRTLSQPQNPFSNDLYIGRYRLQTFAFSSCLPNKFPLMACRLVCDCHACFLIFL